MSRPEEQAPAEIVRAFQVFRETLSQSRTVLWRLRSEKIYIKVAFLITRNRRAPEAL